MKQLVSSNPLDAVNGFQNWLVALMISSNMPSIFSKRDIKPQQFFTTPRCWWWKRVCIVSWLMVTLSLRVYFTLLHQLTVHWNLFTITNWIICFMEWDIADSAKTINIWITKKASTHFVWTQTTTHGISKRGKYGIMQLCLQIEHLHIWALSTLDHLSMDLRLSPDIYESCRLTDFFNKSTTWNTVCCWLHIFKIWNISKCMPCSSLVPALKKMATKHFFDLHLFLIRGQDIIGL